MTPLDGSGLVDLVKQGRAKELADRLASLDEGQRKALSVDLVAFAKGYAAEWGQRANPTRAVIVAAVGCMSSASSAAALIGRRNLSWEWAQPFDTALVVRVARERGIVWLGDLALRLTDRLDREPGLDAWGFTANLLHIEGMAPPTHERFLRGWLRRLVTFPDGGRSAPLVDRLRDDPLLDTLILPAFDIDEIATQGGWDGNTWTNDPVLILAVAQLALEGRLDRTAVLDGCLSVFTAGRRPGVTRAFVALHETLAPNTGEIAARRTRYVRLLGDAPGNVAGVAQKALRHLDDAGALEFEAVLDGSRAVLPRSEKGLVKAQLSWLDRLARRHPARAGEIAEVVALALTHPAADLRDRAEAFVGKHGAGLEAVAEPLTLVDLLPAAAPVAAMPKPIASADELAEEVALLDRTAWHVTSFERVLDGIVRLRAADPEGLARALPPVLGRFRGRLQWHHSGPDQPVDVAGQVVTLLELAASLPTRAAPAHRALHTTVAEGRRLHPHDGLHAFLVLRLAELVAWSGPLTELASTPTSVNGLLDPAALVDRLARAERDGRRFGDRDLLQALYRLPTAIPDEAIAAAQRVRTPQAAQFVDWARQAPAAPVSAVALKTRVKAARGQYSWQTDWLPTQRAYATVTNGGGRDPDGLFELPTPAGITAWYLRLDVLSLYPAVLPAHRDVIAAYVLPHLAAMADMDLRGSGGLLPAIAECTGPDGPATHLALGYGLGARHAPDRIAALDALLAIAASDTGDTPAFDAPGFGAQLGQMVATRLVLLSRLVPSLRDAAQTAPTVVWQLVSAALPTVLPLTTVPRGLPDLLTLAAETATATGAHAPVPGLADLASRPGSSRLLVEARRLQRALAAPSPHSSM
jgi:hypothetical protein